eukprot:875816_1
MSISMLEVHKKNNSLSDKIRDILIIHALFFYWVLWFFHGLSAGSTIFIDLSAGIFQIRSTAVQVFPDQRVGFHLQRPQERTVEVHNPGTSRETSIRISGYIEDDLDTGRSTLEFGQYDDGGTYSFGTAISSDSNNLLQLSSHEQNMYFHAAKDQFIIINSTHSRIGFGTFNPVSNFNVVGEMFSSDKVYVSGSDFNFALR